MKNKTKTKATAKTSSKPRTMTAKQAQVQEALQVTWLLKGKLKSAQIAYLRIGELLVRVRDKKLYAELKHADMEEYARERLQLGRTSLYKYLKVYDWVSKYYPEWLQKKPKGFIPELYDVADLMWIESELKKKNLAPAKKAALEELRKQALDGQLAQSDVRKIRSSGAKTEDSLKSFVSKLRNLRMRGFQLASMPQEAITHIDAAIDIIKNAKTLAQFRISPGKGWDQLAVV